MKQIIGWLVLSLVLAATPAHAIPIGSGGGPSVAPATPAQPPKKNIHPRVAHEQEARDRDRKIWAALPVGAVLGFGLGHLMQERLNGYAITYPVADAVGWGLVISGMGSCRSDPNCEKQKNHRRKAGLILLGASRVAQIIDLAIFGVKYERKASLSLTPLSDGATLSAHIRF